MPLKVLFFANTDWYLYNFRLSLALALRRDGHDVLLTSPAGPYGKKLEKLGFRWIPAPMDRRSLQPLRELALLFWLRRLLLAERPDLVHGFTIKCAVYGSLAARLASLGGHPMGRVNAVAGMGYVFTSGDFKARILRPVVRGLMRLALDGQNSRLILQNPDDVAFFTQESLVNPARVRLIRGSGVDCRHFAPTDRGRTGTGRSRVLLAGRLLWDKGLAELVEAARLVRAQGHDVEFLIAGDPDQGNPAAVPEATVRGWVQEGLLQWLGHVDDMVSLFHTMDVVVMPSYREGLPKGLIEAAACGLPLIATDVPGCREVVTHDVDGLLVPVKNGEALAAAIVRLHVDPALRQRLGGAARAKALAHFDERIIIERTLGVYRELVGTAMGQTSEQSNPSSSRL